MTKSDNKGIVFRCLFAFILFLTASFIFFKTDSYAASFTHKHTDACYNEVQAYAKHTLRNLYEDTTAHCGNCGCQRTFRVSSWTENCSGPCGSRYAGCTISCTVCGHINHKDRIDQPSGHYYTTRGLVCGKDETSSTAATVTLAPITITPTNTSVVIDAAVAVEDPNFALADAPYDFGNGYGSSSTFEVTENGTYTVNVMDNQGRVVSTSVTVDCIDKDLPIITSITKSTEAWTEAGVTITVEAGDEKSGLAEAPYSYEGGAFTSDNTYLVTHNGNISVRVKDAAGNITESVITIKNVGRDPAVVAAEERERARLEQLEKERLLKEEAEKKALEEKALQEANKKKALEDAKKKDALKDKTNKDKTAKDKTGKDKTGKDYSLSKDGKTTGGKAYRTADGKLKIYLGKDESGKDIFKILGDDASGNDVSGNKTHKGPKKIDVNNKANLKNGFLDEDEAISSLSEFEEEKSPKWVYASIGGISLKVGGALLLIGLVFFTFFNYIYVKENGRVRLISLSKVKIEDNKVIVSVNSKRFKENGRFLLYFSPWVKIRLKKLPVYVKMDDSKDLIYCDNGTAFIY